MTLPLRLRPYQDKLIRETYDLWNNAAGNVLAVAPTGSGKTVVFGSVLKDANCASVAIAHRFELVSQMSLTLARFGIRHRVIGPDAVRRVCVSLHMSEIGHSFFDPGSKVAVAGVDTLANANQDDPWFRQVRLWIIDEAHHVLEANKWGRAAAMFPNARGLGVTATPNRADGRGVGREGEGIFDAMVEGPGMRELIDAGYLTEYRVFAPPSDLDLTDVPVTDSGDYSPAKLRKAVHRSHVMGDIVQHYLRHAPGKLGVTFAVDVEAAVEITKRFRDSGIAAEVVSAKTPDALRAKIIRDFRERRLLQLVNVDLFGEGFDLPAIEVVSFGRPTKSFPLFSQQFGRALRPLEGKGHAIILDHVGNTLRHGLPDSPRVWSLGNRKRSARVAEDDVIPTRTCPNAECLAVYERVHFKCPYCGFQPEPLGRATPAHVDGDLTELDVEALRAMAAEIQRIDAPARVPPHLPPIAQAGVMKTHRGRQQAQVELRRQMALWCGWQKHLGRDDREIVRRFYFQFGVDVGSAQALNAADAGALQQKIEAILSGQNVIDGTVSAE